MIRQQTPDNVETHPGSGLLGGEQGLKNALLAPYGLVQVPRMDSRAGREAISFDGAGAQAAAHG